MCDARLRPGIIAAAPIMAIAAAATAMKTGCSASDNCWADGWSDVAMPALTSAPKLATPTALPMDRANMVVEVASPRSDQSTLDCVAIRVGLATRPMPPPMTKQNRATCHTGESGVSRVVSSAPTAASALPMIADHRNQTAGEQDPARECPQRQDRLLSAVFHECKDCQCPPTDALRRSVTFSGSQPW